MIFDYMLYIMKAAMVMMLMSVAVFMFNSTGGIRFLLARTRKKWYINLKAELHAKGQNWSCAYEHTTAEVESSGIRKKRDKQCREYYARPECYAGRKRCRHTDH